VNVGMKLLYDDFTKYADHHEWLFVKRIDQTKDKMTKDDYLEQWLAPSGKIVHVHIEGFLVRSVS